MEVVLVFGEICSGKGYICAQMYRDHKILSCSSFVKSLSKFTDRKDLGTTGDLSKHICYSIADTLSELHEAGINKVVLEGIRQWSIAEFILSMPITSTLVWVEASTDIRKRRYELRKAAKDGTLSFEEATESDNLLGMSYTKRILLNLFKDDLVVVDNN